jgi:hypothetical protein
VPHWQAGRRSAMSALVEKRALPQPVATPPTPRCHRHGLTLSYCRCRRWQHRERRRGRALLSSGVASSRPQPVGRRVGLEGWEGEGRLGVVAAGGTEGYPWARGACCRYVQGVGGAACDRGEASRQWVQENTKLKIKPGLVQLGLHPPGNTTPV